MGFLGRKWDRRFDGDVQTEVKTDRILGTRLGVAATDLVAKHQFGRMVCLKSGKIESVSLDEALEKMKYVDPVSEIVHAARSVGATFGDSA